MNIPNAAVELIHPNIIKHPGKTIYYCEGRTITFLELHTAAYAFAKYLKHQNISPGDRIMIILPDCFAFPIAFLGTILAGAVAVAVSTVLRECDVNHILLDSGSSLVVTHPALSHLPFGEVARIYCTEEGFFDLHQEAEPFVEPYQPSDSDFAYMLYSSGSTGVPKGIPHRHSSLLLPADLVGGPVLGITGVDLIFSASKFSFAYGLISSLSIPLRFGASAVLCPGKADAPAILNLIGKYRPTVFLSVPTVYTQIILSCPTETLKLPMRLCYSAGEALPAALFHEWKRLTGIELTDGIGSTELAWVFISNYPGEAVPGSAGRLVPGFKARIVDAEGNDVPPGTSGNLLVSGASASPFYWNLPEKSAVTMLPGNFIATGDIFIERDGNFFHQGRSDDMIKSGAHWVSPILVENTLRTHPAVVDCAVAAVTAVGLAKPGAFVVLDPRTEKNPCLERELRAHILSQLPDYMCPVRICFVDELPRTSTGKIQRFQLRESPPA